MTGRLRVALDGTAFFEQTRSGITRYFAELAGQFVDHPDHGIDPVMPYRYVANEHLPAALPGQFRKVELPRRLRGPAFRALNGRRVRRARGSFDLVHHTGYRSTAGGPSRGVPRVATVFDFILERFPEAFSWGAEAAAEKNAFLAECDALVCISQATMNDLARFLPDLAKPTVVTPLGVGEEFFKPIPGRRAWLPERYVLHVGNRLAHKNAPILFRGFAAVADTFPELSLVLCGNPLTAQEKELLEVLGVISRVVVRRVSDRELPDLYAQASALAFPSRYEGFGFPVLEAMAAGCPVVCSSTEALVEVADDAALYFSPDDVGGLAASVERIMTDTALRSRLRCQGRRRAQNFSWRRTAELTARAYRSIQAAR